MDDTPVIREIVGRDGDDIESQCANLINLSRSDRLRRLTDARLRAKNSAEIGRRFAGSTTDEYRDSRRIEFRFLRFEREVLGFPSAHSMNAILAMNRPYGEFPYFDTTTL